MGWRLRAKTRWIPEGSQEVNHPEGLAVAYIRQLGQHFAAIGYHGKANNHDFHISFKTHAEAEQYVLRYFQRINVHKETVAARRVNRKAAEEQPLKPGEYVSVARTAKLIRAALNKKFPGVKFSVRSDSYSGGASVDIRYTDGPTEKQVRQITDPFSGSGFDGMIDLKYSVKSWLGPSGFAYFGRSAGTGGSGGSDPDYDFPAPETGSIMVHFGSDHVFVHRAYSVAVMEKVAHEVAQQSSLAIPEVKVHNDGSAYLVGPSVNQRPDEHARFSLSELIHQRLREVAA